MINAHPHSTDNSNTSTGAGANSNPPVNSENSSFAHSAEIKNDLNSSFGGSQMSSRPSSSNDSMPGTHPSHSPQVPKNEPASGFHFGSSPTSTPAADTVPTNAGSGPNNSNGNSSHSNKPQGSSGLKSFGLKKIAGVAILLLLVVGSGAAYYLQTQNQDVRQQAAYYQWEKKLDSGLTVELPNCGANCKPDTDYLNSGSISGYKPMSANVSESNYKPGETINFKVPVKNTTSGAITDQYSFKVFKITEYRESGAWKQADDKTAKSESEMYSIHKNNGENGADGTKQTRVHNGGWEQVTVQPGQTMNFSGSWKPGSNDCGIYQIDMFASPDKNDSDYTNIIGAGFIRVTGCEAPPQDAICKNVTLSKTTATAGENITVNIEASNIKSHSFNYLSTATDACQIDQWKKANVVEQLPGVYTWNTSGLTPGEYHLSVDSTDNNGTFCGGNPNGTCGYDVQSCPDCNAKITIVAPSPTPSRPPVTPTVGSGPQCISLCATTNPAGCQPTAGNDGSIAGTPKIGDTVYFNCAYNPSNVSYQIDVYKDGQVVKTVNAASTSYKIESAAAYSARCRNTGTGGGTQPTQAPPTPTPTNTISDNRQLCIQNGGTCAYNCSRNQSQITTVNCGTDSSGTGMVCCKDNPIVIPTNNLPTPTKAPTSSVTNCGSLGGTCRLSSQCLTGSAGSVTNCNAQGQVCCLPASNQ